MPTKKPQKLSLFTEIQKETLTAIADTFIATLTPEEEVELIKTISEVPNSQFKDTQLSLFSRTNASQVSIIDRIEKKIPQTITPKQFKDFLLVVNLFSHHPTNFLLTGHWTLFKDLKRSEREQVVLGWKRSSLATIRRIYASFMGLFLTEGYFAIDKPLFDGLQYPGVLVGHQFFETQTNYEPIQHERLNMLSTTEALGYAQFDAIVIGSGAGGGVVAAELSKAGLSVLVIEKGKYFHQDDLVPDDDFFAFTNMYENGGITPNGDGTVNILAGATFGGGTSINYSVCLKPPAYVKEEWSKLGLPYFTSQQFEDDLNTACEKIGASTENIVHNGPNQKLIEGSRKLGYNVADVPLNTSGKPHHCGKCYTGCKSGIKNSTQNTWLKEAQENGVKFLDRSRVNRILTRNGQAIGVVCNVHGIQDHVYRAKYVVVAAGSLHTPSLLIKSGLKNSNIGRNLRLHLSSLVCAIYDQVIHPTQGTLLSCVTDQFENFDGTNHGFKIECFPLGIGMHAGVISWEGSKDHKAAMLRYPNSVITFAMMRDKDSKCNVKYDDYGKYNIEFSLSKHDAANLKEGIVQMAKIHVAAGAREIHASQHTIKPFKFMKDEKSDVNNPRFLKWLDEVYKANPPIPASGHQIASCRMGANPKTSAVKQTGETWDVRNLYVADGSVFPGALGVNPMITIQSIALSTSRNIIQAFKHQTPMANL